MTPEELAQAADDLGRLMKAAAAETNLLGTRQGAANTALQSFQRYLRSAGADVTELSNATRRLAQAEERAARSAEQQAAAQEAAAESYKRNVSATAKNLGNTTQSMVTSMAAGNEGFQQVASTAQSAAAALGGLASGIPVIGGFLDSAAKTIGDAAGFIIGQLDVVAKAYTQLGQVGAITTTGVEGLRDQFKRLGLVQLPDFVAAVTKSSMGLAALGNTTSRGSVMLGDSLGEITDAQGPFVKQLLAMGFSIQEITSTVTQFGASQTLLGNRQIRTTRDLTLASVEYLKEIDLLARATGRSREAVLDEQKKMEADVKFRAKLEEMRATGQAQAADELEKLVRSVGGPVGDAIRASVAGVPLTKEAQGAFVLMGGAISDSIRAIQEGSTAERERMKVLQAGVNGVKDFNSVIQYGASEALGGDGVVKQLMDFQALLRRAQEKGVDPFVLAQQEIEELAKNNNKTTESFVSAQISVANFGRNLQRMGFEFIEPATAAIEKFTTVLNDAAIKIAKMFGVQLAQTPGTPTTPGRQAPASQVAQKEAERAQSVANTKLEEAAVANDKLRAAEKELKQARLANDRSDAGRARIKELEDRVVKAKEEAAIAEEAEAKAATEARVAHQKHRQKIQEANKIANSVATYEAEILRAQSDIAKHTQTYDKLMKEKADNAGKETYQATTARDYVIKRQQQEIAAAEERLKNNTDKLSEARKKLGDNLMEAVKTGKTAQAPTTYMEKMIAAESGGRNIGATGGRSSAYGVGQMLKGTFEDLAKSAGKGNPLQGKTFEDYKKDVGLQMEALQQLTSNNSQRLRDANLKVTDASLYMAHFLGPDGAIRVLQSPDNTEISKVVSSDAMMSNPEVFSSLRSVKDLKDYIDKKMGNTGYRYGGIASGPKGGYPAMLHGTEAIIPLQNGHIPVQITSKDLGFEEVRDQFQNFAQEMQYQGALLAQLVELQRANNSTARGILQASTG